MRLLILTQYYPPETGAPQNRLSDLAQRLVGRGHQVEVLTALPNYPGDRIHDGYEGREGTVEVMNGVRVARVGLYVPLRKTFSRRVACYSSFAANAVRHGPKLVGQPDVILMESPPLFIAPAGVYLARRLGARLVPNISDLWPQSVVDLGMLKPGPALWAAQGLETWMYRSADAITCQSQGILDEIQKRVPGTPMLLFPNGVDVDLFARPLDPSELRASFGWTPGQLVFGYAGVLGHAQALGQILDAAKLVSDLEPVHFAFFGDGPRRKELEERIQREAIHNAAVYPAQPRSKMPMLQAAFDVGLVPLAKGRVFEGVRPSKMFEIMGSARPLIACVRGETRSLIDSAPGGPVGLCVDPEEPAQLADAVRKLIGSPNLARELGACGRAYVTSHFNRENIAVTVEQFLSRITNSTPARRVPVAAPPA
jgi:glycosyltransferase involved in cell wall biosynthesis